MPETPAYVVLGRGRWAKKMQPLIEREGRAVTAIAETRQHPSEAASAYVSRLAEAMKASHAQVAWLCVPPGPHVPLLVQAALEGGLHVVVEKPWYGSAADTERLEGVARVKRRLLAVHFEYLVHREVQNWRERFHRGAGLRFGGHFFLSRPDHLGLPATDNLGGHLMAIREFSVPESAVSEVQCAYERPDERRVWLERGTERIASIDLFKGSERIIQDFMKKAEAALDGAGFPFDLSFALRVENQLNAYKARCRA